jgi:uncharacterized repeat protein (TIGR01451 family)
VPITAGLVTAGLQVAAAGNDITFDNTALNLNIANCAANPSLMRMISGGVVGTVGNLTTVRILVLGAPLNTDPIPDGPLYTCNFDILASASPGTYTLTALNFVAQDPNGVNLSPVTGANGSITVTLVGPTATVTNTPTITLTPSLTATVTNTPTSTVTATATNTATATATGVPTATSTSTATPTATPTVTDTPTVTNTPTSTFTSTQTPTVTQTPTATNTPLTIHINLGTGTGLPGHSVPITASLVTSGLQVAAAGNDITFDNTALSLNIANCVANPSLMRMVSGGVVGTVGNLTTMRILVIGAPLNTDPIPDGPLYTCTFDILGSASPAVYPLTALNFVAQDPNGVNLSPVTGANGSITVTLVGPTATVTNTPTITLTPSVTATATDTPTATNTPTDTATATATNTATDTPTGIPTATPTDTPTATPTNTATFTPTDTPTNTPTATATFTPTNTPTVTDTPTVTETPTITQTPTPSETPTPSQTPISVLLTIGDGNGLAGQQVDIATTINSSILGVQVAGTGNDITFDNTVLGIDPLNCTPNPALGKILSAAIVKVSGTSTTLRVFVQGPPINNDPIPDGLLYTCRFDILGGALPGVYALLGSNEIAEDPDAMPVGPVQSVDGQVTVVLVAPTSTPSLTPTITETPSVTPTLTPTDTPTFTPTDTPTNTPTFTPTNTPTETPTPTPTMPPPKLSISAVGSRDPIGAGQLLTYTFLFGNAGGPAIGVTVTATIPAGTTFQSASPAAASAPGVGGTGTVTWNFAELPLSGGGMVTMTVLVDPGLADGTVITLTGYQIATAMPPGIMPELGPDLTTTVETDLTLEIKKVDEPDGVQPGDQLTYEITVSNRGGVALHDLLVRELFDPELEAISSLPAPDLGTIDRWSIPFLPAGMSRTISVTAQVKADSDPGAIIRNMAQVSMEDGSHPVASTYEDTLIVGPPVLGMSIDDLPDPVGPNDELTYAITFSNISDQDITGVTVYADPDPNLVFQSSSPAPDGTLFWNIGDMSSTSAERIFATFTVNPTTPNQLFDGVLLPMRTWVLEDGGNVASALAVTLYRTEPGRDNPYLLDLSGAPRNLRIGVVDTAVYLIKLTNQGNSTTTGVVVNDALPNGLDFVESDPPPTTIAGNLVSFNFPSMQPGETKLIVVKAQLGPTAVAGSSLTNRTYVVDAQGNSIQATFTGGVRQGSPADNGKLSLSLTMPKTLTIAGGRPGTLKSSLTITNGARSDANNVVVTLEGPATAAYSSSTPGAASQELIPGGMLRLTWVFPSVKGPGNETIKLNQTVAASVPDGANLSFRATVQADDGRNDSATRTVQVRNRSTASP